MAICLVVLMVAPLVTLLGYETVGHRDLDAALIALLPPKTANRQTSTPGPATEG
jgi:hypothetical protein